MALSKTVSGAEMESGFADHPGHTLTVEPAASRITVRAGDELLIDTNDALVLREGEYAPAYYFPRSAIDMNRLNRTDHTTWCPFKGCAAYYSIGDDPALANAVWTYEDPFEEVGAIKDRIAFYADKVVIDVV
ncbi:MAG: DUF427 domain-containing protein [Pseudomonadota bacterium]